MIADYFWLEIAAGAIGCFALGFTLALVMFSWKGPPEDDICPRI